MDDTFYGSITSFVYEIQVTCSHVIARDSCLVLFCPEQENLLLIFVPNSQVNRDVYLYFY